MKCVMWASETVENCKKFPWTCIKYVNKQHILIFTCVAWAPHADHLLSEAKSMPFTPNPQRLVCCGRSINIKQLKYQLLFRNLDFTEINSKSLSFNIYWESTAWLSPHGQIGCFIITCQTNNLIQLVLTNCSVLLH